MTPEFKTQMRAELQVWRSDGVSATDAARRLERLCGKANEDYGTPVRVEGRGKLPEGQLLVEEVYGGELSQLPGGGGLTFVLNGE